MRLSTELTNVPVRSMFVKRFYTTLTFLRVLLREIVKKALMRTEEFRMLAGV